MAIHRKLSNGDLEGVAKVAVAALKQSRAQATAPSGSLSITNADGTTTIIGAANETGTTIAAHVGDTEAPGAPTGITATTEGLGATVIWDGTLTGGIPSDFLQVTIYASTTDGETVAGVLSEAGSITVGPYADGAVVTFYATAEDDVCDEQGNPAHNVSERSEDVAVTINDRAGHAADSAADAAKSATSAAEMATEAAEAVLATSQHFFADDAGAHVATTAGEPDTGPNSLWNSEGLLIRDGSNPLTAVTPSGLSVYDGEGTAEGNVVALLSKDTVELGRGNTAATISMCGDTAIVRTDVASDLSSVSTQIGPNFYPYGTDTSKTSPVTSATVGLVPYSGSSGGVPTPADMGFFFTDNVTENTAQCRCYNSDLIVDGIVYTPAMSHAKQTFEATYSGMSFDRNAIELSVTRGIATIRIDVGFKKSGSVGAWASVLPSDLETAIMSWATPPSGGVQFSFQDMSRSSTWMASLNKTAGKCYLWPSAKFTPTTLTYVTGTFTWPVAY